MTQAQAKAKAATCRFRVRAIPQNRSGYKTIRQLMP